MPYDQIDVLETVAHLGDIAQTHDRAVVSAEDDNLLEILLIVTLAEGPNPHL